MGINRNTIILAVAAAVGVGVLALIVQVALRVAAPLSAANDLVIPAAIVVLLVAFLAIARHQDTSQPATRQPEAPHAVPSQDAIAAAMPSPAPASVTVPASARASAPLVMAAEPLPQRTGPLNIPQV